MYTLLEAFVRQIKVRPNSLALVTAGRTEKEAPFEFTWAELGSRVAQTTDALCAYLHAHSANNRHVLYHHRNQFSDICISLACGLAGFVEVPIDARRNDVHGEWVRRQLAGVWLDDAFVEKATNALSSATNAARKFDRYVQDIQDEQPALVLWTTGTVAEPKGVILSHRNLFGNALAKLNAVPQTTDDVRLTTLPLSHAYARTCDFGTWLLSGSTLVLSLGYRGWETIARRYPPTIANVVPSLAYQILNMANGQATSRLNLLGVGGAPLRDQAFEELRARRITVIQGYGLTETSPVICSATPQNAAPGLVGTPVDGWEVQLRGGRMFVRGPHVMLGYWNDDDATRARLSRDGWFDTGDLAELDEATGQYRIVGRADDVVVLPNGYKLHPRDIESWVEDLPGVEHALVLLHPSTDELQLWLDVETNFVIDDVARQLSRVATPLRPKTISTFNPRLTVDKGELTFKGSLRRDTVLRNRFSKLNLPES